MAHLVQSNYPQRRPAHRVGYVDKATQRQALAEAAGFATVQEWMDAGNSLPGERKAPKVLNEKKLARAEAQAARAKLPEGVANERLSQPPEDPPSIVQASDVPSGMPVLSKGQKPPRSLPQRGDRAARFVGKTIAPGAADPGFAGLTSEADLNGVQTLKEKTTIEEEPKKVVPLPKPVVQKPKKPKPAAKKTAQKKVKLNGGKIS